MNGELTLFLHCCPTGIWSINFPPETIPPPNGPLNLFFSTELLLLVLGRSYLFCPLLVSDDANVSISVAQHKEVLILFIVFNKAWGSVLRGRGRTNVPSLLWLFSGSSSPSIIDSLLRKHPQIITPRHTVCPFTPWAFSWDCFECSYQSSSSSVMHFSYTGPWTSFWLGKMLSCCRMMLLITALMTGCSDTSSSPSAPLTRLGPKHTARL